MACRCKDSRDELRKCCAIHPHNHSCAKHSSEKQDKKIEHKGHEQSKFHHICGDMGCKKRY